MQTLVYIKMDAPDQLLLSEGVCRQLGIVTYHQDVSATEGTQKDRRGGESCGTSQYGKNHLPSPSSEHGSASQD